MVLRETDETSGGILRGMKGWLRQIFIVDKWLKLLALLITLVLWYGVTGQRSPATIPFRHVQLNFRVPQDMEISNEPRTEVDVTLTGSKRELERLNARDLVATVDVTDYQPGERVVQLVKRRVMMDLPPSVRVEDIEPNTIPLRLEQRIEREVEVEARLEGNLPDGYELRGIQIAPAKVRVRGPASHVNALQKVPTETIRLDGLKADYDATQAAVDISDSKVDVIDTVVNVHLEIGELRIEKSFAGVVVRDSEGAQARPATASVTLYGPRTVLDGLRPEQIQLILEAAPDGSITPRLVLPADLAGRVELRSTRPAGFSIIK